MTIQELIDKLLELPPDAEVAFYDEDCTQDLGLTGVEHLENLNRAYLNLEHQ